MTIIVGEGLIIVPDLVALLKANAEAAIIAAGLVVGAITTANSDTVPAGNVISQSPLADASVPAGTGVDLSVSLGVAPVVVPDVVGLTQAAAEAAIIAASLAVGTVTTANSTAVPTGGVIRQNPAGGSSVAAGSSVDLVVSLGAVPTTVPDVVGQDQASAEADIIAASLAVGTVTTANSATVPTGDVIRQDPAGGSSVAAGSAVDLVVSLGAVPVTVTYQEGVNGYSSTVDTFVHQGVPTSSFGNLDSLEWDQKDIGGKPKWALVRFDEIFGVNPGQIPPGPTVDSATLTYEVSNHGDEADVNEVLVDWAENVTYNTFGGDPGIAPDEYGALVQAASGFILAGSHSIDVTVSIAAWAVDPTANQGWILLPTGSNGVDLRSSEYATVADRPKLEVTYNSAPPTQ